MVVITAAREQTLMLLGATQQLDFLTRGLSFTARSSMLVLNNIREIFGRQEPPSFHYNPIDESYTLDPRGNYCLQAYREQALRSLQPECKHTGFPEL